MTYQDFISAIENFDERYAQDITQEQYFGFPLAPVLEAENRLSDNGQKSVAYFSMEFGLAPSIYNTFELRRPRSMANQFFTHEVFSNYWLCDYLFRIHIDKMLDIPIYGGGLGVLAGDTVKSAADLNYSMAAIGVLWNKGYFKQNFWYKHGQVPEELQWDPHTYPGLIPLKNIVVLHTQEGPLNLRLWKYYVYSFDRKHACPIILLDSNLGQNSERFRKLTDQLYRSDDNWWKIYQRAILGIGGMKALAHLGYHVSVYHLNEGHAAFALLERYVSLDDKEQFPEARNDFVFTCHTPVAAGHDRFSVEQVKGVLDGGYVESALKFGRESPGSDQINLTLMSLNHCRGINAVSKKHDEVMKIQFPDFSSKIVSITNGIHIHTWISESFQKLFDRYADAFGDWRRNPENLRAVLGLKGDEQFRKDLFSAHQANKRNLVGIVKNWRLKEDVLTLGWARRIAGYKRPGLIFHQIHKLLELVKDKGPLQIIMAGKAHPNDDIGHARIGEILDHIDRLNRHKDLIRVLILENYDTFFGRLLTNSVDVWLNNPLPPFEASGTSGMKAILNGVLQLSTLDGWVAEAASHDIGWIFGYQHQGRELGNESELRLKDDSDALYETLAQVIPLYYQTFGQGQINAKSIWIDKMINCVEQSAFFNTQRMIKEYNDKMWGKCF